MAEEAHTAVHLQGILLAYCVLLLGILSPGPAILAIIGTALQRGRKPALGFALGVASGSTIWGILAALGFGTLMAASAGFLTVLKFLGGLYLLWLAWKSLQSARAGNRASPPTSTIGEVGLGRLWVAGLLLHLTNPKAVLAWIATVALGMTATSPWWVAFLIVAGGALISTVGNTAYAIIFSTDTAARTYLRLQRPIGYALTAILGAAGVKLLTDRS